MLILPVEKMISSENETAALAAEFAGKLEGGEVICLNGQLGAGKTFFIKNLLSSFGIRNVSSPTFALVNQYNGNADGRSISFNHFDFYRINNEQELYDIGFDEYISGDAVTLIEWAELFPAVLPGHRIEITISVNEDFTRNIIINKL